MILQLYSDTDLLLKRFRFEPGINIILGKYSDNKEKKGINGIGKSSLVRLIDYLLLSNSAESKFAQPKYDFLRTEKHTVTLEFNLDNKSYFMKRSFVKDDKILFGESPDKLEEYSKGELRVVLSNKYFPFSEEDVVFKGERYGTLMDFFIKDDLENHVRVEPTNFSQGTTQMASRAIFNFFLLGLPTKNIIQFEGNNSEYDGYSRTIAGLENKVKSDYGKTVEEFKSERIKIEENISLLEKSAKDYKFLEKYKNIEGKLVEITSVINDRLKEYHAQNRKLRKVKDSFQFNQEVDIRQISKLYNEAKETFGDLVSKTLDDITMFKKEILENRNKFLYAKEFELQKSINSILEGISELEMTRSELYKKLEEKGALESITKTYEQLALEKSKLGGHLQIVKQIDDLQEKMGNLSVTISEVKRDLLSDLKQYESTINNLRKVFLEILKNAIYLDEDNPSGYFDVKMKASSARNQLPFDIDISIPKADALGLSRLKIVAYDLMVFINSISEKRKLPKFLIHDGVYHGISLNTIIKSLNYIYHKFLTNPHFQYIVTFNEDEIYIPEEKGGLVGKFDFDIAPMIAAEFTDSPDGMIFKRDFK